MGLTSHKTNWLENEKYISNHINIDYKINSGRDTCIEENITEFSDIMTNAAVLVGLRKITNVEIEKLVTVKSRVRCECKLKKCSNVWKNTMGKIL